MFKTKSRAFTLIELLIVIAVIGVISSIVIANISTARMKARDQKRISDFRTFKIALDMYYDTNGKYPTSPNLATSWADENYNFETVAGILVSSGFFGCSTKGPKGYTRVCNV